MSNFELASRLKLRIETAKGNLSVEDLWTLPLTSKTGAVNLNDLAKGLYRKLQNTDEVSFVTEAAKPEDSEAALTFAIVKHIIEVRLAENVAAATERDRKEKREKILEILSRKEDESLEKTSPEDLRAMLAAL